MSDIDLTCPCNLKENACDVGCCCDQVLLLLLLLNTVWLRKDAGADPEFFLGGGAPPTIT